MDTMTDHEALAQAIADRRRELGLTQQDLSERTRELDPRDKGVSPRTIGNIEQVAGTRPQPGTVRLLDAALEWPLGTVEAILRGEEPPREVGDAARITRLEERVAQLTATVDDLVDLVAILQRLGRRERDDE